MDTPRSCQFDGIWLPMVTPMREGRVDLEATLSLARYYKDAGIDGLVLFGSTGEGNLLTMAEKFEMVSAIQSDENALPIVAGIGGIDTRSVTQCIQQLDLLDLAGYLAPPPYYLGPSQEGIVWHYEQIVEATARPVILYNIPKRAGVAMTVKTMTTIFEYPNVVGVKECDPVMLRELNAMPGVQALCGDDGSFVDYFLEGGTGAIVASAHVYPERFVKAMRLARTGQAAAARAEFYPLRSLIQMLFDEPNPAPVKKVLAMQGLIADELRLPMTAASPALERRLQHALEHI